MKPAKHKRNQLKGITVFMMGNLQVNIEKLSSVMISTKVYQDFQEFQKCICQLLLKSNTVQLGGRNTRLTQRRQTRAAMTTTRT